MWSLTAKPPRVPLRYGPGTCKAHPAQEQGWFIRVLQGPGPAPTSDLGLSQAPSAPLHILSPSFGGTCLLCLGQRCPNTQICPLGQILSPLLPPSLQSPGQGWEQLWDQHNPSAGLLHQLVAHGLPHHHLGQVVSMGMGGSSICEQPGTVATCHPGHLAVPAAGRGDLTWISTISLLCREKNKRRMAGARKHRAISGRCLLEHLAAHLLTHPPPRGGRCYPPIELEP